jgi:hypothetical protein
MSPTPKQFRELILRDIVGFILVGGVLLLAFVVGQESLERLSKQFTSKLIAAESSEDLVAEQPDGSPTASDASQPAPGWQVLADSALPFTMYVPTSMEKLVSPTPIEIGKLPLRWSAWQGIGNWKRGDLELTVKWGQADTRLPREELTRFLRREPSRLLVEQGLTPRVGLSEGRTWREGSRYGFRITAELDDGRRVATLFDLSSEGILQVQAIFREQPQQPWPIEELFRSFQIQTAVQSAGIPDSP